MSDFNESLADLHRAVGQALHRAFDAPAENFTPSEIRPLANDSAFTKPIATAQAAACIEGMAATIAEMGEARAHDRAMLNELAVALRSGGGADREQIARQLRHAVRLLASGLVPPDILARRIELAAERLADSNESALLRLHPDDVAPLEGKLPTTVFAIGDAGVGRGSFILESASAIIEDRPEQWLEQLAQAMVAKA
ncbi:MAG: flagellar biosynthesis protein FliH [Sphingomonas bacterium]